MKNEELTPADLTLDEINQRFSTDEDARAYWESIHWPNGPACPHCKNAEAKLIYSITPNKSKKIRDGLRHCAKCSKQFTATVGTIFEDSHIPLRKWLIAWYLVCSSKKGISSLQLQRNLGLGSYRTALFMTHRIRHALRETSYPEKLDGTVEADEAAMGGYMKGGQTGYSAPNKTPIVAMVQRGGKVRTKVMPSINGANLRQAIRDNVKAGASLHTDGQRAFWPLKGEYKHSITSHVAGEFTRKEGENVISTASVESFFSLLKRGVMGTFHHISAQHLPLYLAEFEHRHNTRLLTDGERTVVGMKKAAGKRLTYREQTRLNPRPD